MLSCFLPKTHRAEHLPPSSPTRTLGHLGNSSVSPVDTYLPSLERKAARATEPYLNPLALVCALHIADRRALGQLKHALETKAAQLEDLSHCFPLLQKGVDEDALVRLRTSDDQILVYHRSQFEGTGSFFDAAARWEGSRDKAILVPFSKQRVQALMEQLICERHGASDVDDAARDYFFVGVPKLNHKNPDDIARLVGDLMNAIFRAFSLPEIAKNAGKHVKISAKWVQNLQDFLNGLRPLDPAISAYPQPGEDFRLIVPEIYKALGQYVVLPDQEPQTQECPYTGLGIDLAQYFIHTPLSGFYRRKELEGVVALLSESDHLLQVRIYTDWLYKFRGFITNECSVPGSVRAFRDSHVIARNVVEFFCQIHGFPQHVPENWNCGLQLVTALKYYNDIVVRDKIQRGRRTEPCEN